MSPAPKDPICMRFHRGARPLAGLRRSISSHKHTLGGRILERDRGFPRWRPAGPSPAGNDGGSAARQRVGLFSTALPVFANPLRTFARLRLSGLRTSSVIRSRRWLSCRAFFRFPEPGLFCSRAWFQLFKARVMRFWFTLVNRVGGVLLALPGLYAL